MRNSPLSVAVIQRLASLTNRSTMSTTQIPTARISSGAIAW
jgi:hypothetical protein